MNFFINTRLEALEFWISNTGRKIYSEEGFFLLTDSIEDTYECYWQNKFTEKHVNLFCSLGDWACNLTDLLREESYDELDFDKPEEARVLFRHYTRILLVVSELLTDFQNIHKIVNPESKDPRSFLSPKNDSNRVHKLFGYINNTCKHKTLNFHVCNNHLPIYFKDSRLRRKKLNYFSIQNTDKNNKEAILVPKLLYLLKTIIYCYKKTNSYFYRNKEKFVSLCEQYSL